MGIGDRIKACRKACDMTLEEVAAQVKLSRQTLSRYETGVIKNIPSDVIERLALVLKTTPGHLMGWDDEEKPAPDDEDELAEKNARLLMWFRSLPEEKQKAILLAQDAPEGLV